MTQHFGKELDAELGGAERAVRITPTAHSSTPEITLYVAHTAIGQPDTAEHNRSTRTRMGGDQTRSPVVSRLNIVVRLDDDWLLVQHGRGVAEDPYDLISRHLEQQRADPLERNQFPCLIGPCVSHRDRSYL
jgi:hypothetical protein